MLRSKAKLLLKKLNNTYLGQGDITKFMTQAEIKYIQNLWEHKVPSHYSFNDVIRSIATCDIKKYTGVSHEQII
jgi:hypothetical protein